MRDGGFSTVGEALEAIARAADRLLTASAPMEPPIGNANVRVPAQTILDAVSWLTVMTVEPDDVKGY